MAVAKRSVMLATAQSAVLVGLAAFPVGVEVQSLRGVPSFELVGLAEAAVRESRVRVKSALAGVGVDLSEYRVVVNLAPADLKKRGSAFDLAIAAATLEALRVVPEGALGDVLFLGELSLSGQVHPLRGAIAHLLGARQRGVSRVVMPRANEREATLVRGLEIGLVDSLEELLASLRGELCLPTPKRGVSLELARTTDDMADVRGQGAARRALEIAAAGGHNLLFMGPPGAGKTMLARRLPGILPPMSRDEALEVMAIHGVAGLHIGDKTAGVRPFRAPHHTACEIALVGGGDFARPGEVSLAHRGVLFLDELAEFRRSALEALRQPLEDGTVTISRAQANATFPARPLVVAATNPCPCGHQGTTRPCSCRPEQLRAYRARLSGPLVDRLDLHVALPPVDVLALQAKAAGEPTSAVRRRVEQARALQADRHRRGETSVALNAHLAPADAERVCRLEAGGTELLAGAMQRLGLSARAYAKVLRVARTVADLEGKEAILRHHVAEAIAGRLLDRGGAGAAVHAA